MGSAAASLDALNDDELLLVLIGCRLSCRERFTVAALVSQRWRRLVCSRDLLRQGVGANIQSAHLERLQSLRRWLRAHGGELGSLDISLSAAGAGVNKAAATELGRCLVAACLGGAVRELRIEWLSRTILRLGPELAAVGACACVRRLTLCAERGTIVLACPLARLTALESAALTGVTRWEGAASLPPFLTSLALNSVSDANGVRLPSQLSALASLRHLSLSGTEYMPPSGYDVLTSLTNLSSLSLTRSRVWPTALRHLTALRRLDLESCGAWSHWAIVAAGPGQAMQQTLQALPYLTTLCLRGSLPRLPAPGQALTEGLQLLVDQSAAVMPAHWPDSLRAAGTSWEQLLAQPLQLGAAPQLRHLAIRPYHSYLWGAAAQQPGWAALWAWLEHAPQLRLLEIRYYCQRWELPMVLSTALAALKRRRPALRVVAHGTWDDQRFLDTAASFCSPGPA